MRSVAKRLQKINDVAKTGCGYRRTSFSARQEHMILKEPTRITKPTLRGNGLKIAYHKTPQPVTCRTTVLTKEASTFEHSNQRPGSNEDSLFSQDWSVSLWRNFELPEDIRNENLPVVARIQGVLNAMQVGISKARIFESPGSTAYWVYHLSRMGFFATQGLLGCPTAGVAFSNYMRQKNIETSNSNSATLQIAQLLRSGLYVPVGEALLTFYQDYENIKRGLYKLPWDLTTPLHKQSNPITILSRSLRFLREANSTMQRRHNGVPEKVWLESGLYPKYYLNSWHYQSDGWLSDESAKVYETSTETVFIGRQDAMQRQSLVPLKDLMIQKRSLAGEELQALEVGCGTGRFATFLKDNYPKMGVTQLDLSPFYLQEARKNLAYWRSRRGGSSPEDTVSHKDRFLQAPAEAIPSPDASFDAVVSIYLFHELPEEARQKAAAEMARVLKPGGMLVFTDGSQLGDRPSKDASIGNFQAFNEPNWGTHIARDYGELFCSQGLVPHKKVLASGTKVLSFMKPLTAVQQ